MSNTVELWLAASAMNFSYILILQLEAANRRIRDLEEQVSLEMQAKDELDHNYRSENLELPTY